MARLTLDEQLLAALGDGGEGGGINIGALLGLGGRGGGGALGSLSEMMELIGLSPKSQREQLSEETQARQQQAQEMYWQGQLNKAAEELGLRRSESEAARKASEADIELKKAQTEVSRAAIPKALREEQAAAKAREDELRAKMTKEVMDAPPDVITPEQKRAYLEEVNPQYAAGQKKKRAKETEDLTTKILGEVESAYKSGKPKAVQTALKAYEGKAELPEILKDPRFTWQPWNEQLQPEKTLMQKAAGLLGFGGAPAAPAAPATPATQVGPPAAAAGGPPLPPPINIGGRALPSAAGPTGAEGGFQYLEGYPSAKPNYMYPGVQTPLPGEIEQRIIAEHPTAEEDLARMALDWWQGRQPQVPEDFRQLFAPKQASAFEYLPGGPSATAPQMVESSRLPWLYGSMIPESHPLPPGVNEEQIRRMAELLPSP